LKSLLKYTDKNMNKSFICKVMSLVVFLIGYGSLVCEVAEGTPVDHPNIYLSNKEENSPIETLKSSKRNVNLWPNAYHPNKNRWRSSDGETARMNLPLPNIATECVPSANRNSREHWSKHDESGDLIGSIAIKMVGNSLDNGIQSNSQARSQLPSTTSSGTATTTLKVSQDSPKIFKTDTETTAWQDAEAQKYLISQVRQ
jgi:hypothetical protein